MESPPRHARSFRPRRRGLSTERSAAFERDAPRWRLDVEGGALDLGTLFATTGLGDVPDVVLDIGFGGGEGLVDMAASRPTECIVGVEVHTPGVARVVEAITEHGWSHVRVVEGDVLDFLPRLPASSLAGVRIWFPDPWPKRKQQHRRLVRPDVVVSLTDRLRLGGTLHVATDIAEYASHTERVVADEPRLSGGVVPRPEWRPLTRFEARGRQEGRVATDLVYTRVG